MQYRPKRDNKNAYFTTAALVVAAFICIITEVLGIGVSLLDQILIVLFLSAALYVYIRFVLTDFVYNVTDDGYIEIVKITAKIPKTLASVKICRSDLIVREEKDMKSYSYVKKKERFNLTLCGHSNRWYIFEMNGEKQALVLEGDDKFFAFLQDKINRSDT